jgi:hypothetical protein
MDELLVLFPGYKNRQGIYMALYRDTFPVPTFKVGGKVFADKDVVKAYFRRLRKEGQELLDQQEELRLPPAEL